MNIRKFPAGVTAFSLVVAALAYAPAASAHNVDIDIRETQEILSIVPENLIVDADESAIAIVETNAIGTEHSVSVESGEHEMSLSMTLGNGSQHEGISGDFEVFHDTEDKSTTLVRASGNGGQVIFAAEGAGGLDDFSINFEKSIEDTSDLGDGEIGVRFLDGSSIIIEKPWALDARGQKLETSLQFGEKSVTQEVVTTHSTTFPIVADPAWRYSYSYDLYKKNPYKVRALMKKPGKFSAIFPVHGAPKNFPKSKQKLPLKVAGMNFSCIYDGEFWIDGRGGRTWGYKFKADKGHVDGVGSTIKFSIVEIATLSGRPGENRLWVDAYIKNSNPANVPRWVYKDGARQNWSGFAAKIRTFA